MNRIAAIAVTPSMLSLLACGGSGIAPEISFAPVPEAALSYFDVGVADMNGDGLSDLVAAGTDFVPPGLYDHHISVFLQDPTAPGRFAAPRITAYGADDPLYLLVADVNRDGLPEVCGKSSWEGGFRIFFQDTANPGVLLPGVHVGPDIEIGELDRRAMATADVDGDGLTDLLYVQFDTIEYYLQDGSNPGTFLDPLPNGAGRLDVVADDIDGDGLADFVTFEDGGFAETDALLYYRQRTATPGEFVTAEVLPFDFRAGNASLADTDGDSRIDIVVSGNRIDGDDRVGYFTVFRQRSDGTFVRTVTQPSATGWFPLRNAVADLNNDGFSEIVVGEVTRPFDPVVLEIFAAGAAGDYTSTAVLSVPDDRAVNTPALRALAIEDMNSDGQPDIVVSTNEIFTFFQVTGQPGVFTAATRITAED